MCACVSVCVRMRAPLFFFLSVCVHVLFFFFIPLCSCTYLGTSPVGSSASGSLAHSVSTPIAPSSGESLHTHKQTHSRALSWTNLLQIPTIPRIEMKEANTERKCVYNTTPPQHTPVYMTFCTPAFAHIINYSFFAYISSRFAASNNPMLNSIALMNVSGVAPSPRKTSTPAGEASTSPPAQSTKR